MNPFLFGDDLQWLRDAKLFPDAGRDLVYLDSRLNSNSNNEAFWLETKGNRTVRAFE